MKPGSDFYLASGYSHSLTSFHSQGSFLLKSPSRGSVQHGFWDYFSKDSLAFFCLPSFWVCFAKDLASDGQLDWIGAQNVLDWLNEIYWRCKGRQNGGYWSFKGVEAWTWMVNVWSCFGIDGAWVWLLKHTGQFFGTYFRELRMIFTFILWGSV